MTLDVIMTSGVMGSCRFSGAMVLLYDARRHRSETYLPYVKVVEPSSRGSPENPEHSLVT